MTTHVDDNSMQIVSAEEYENRHTVRLVLENRRGEQETYERAYGADVQEDGSVVVQFPDPTSEIEEQRVEEYGETWRIVDVTAMNAGPYADRPSLTMGDEVTFVHDEPHEDIPTTVQEGRIEEVGPGDELQVRTPEGNAVTIARDDVREVLQQ